MGSLPYTNSQMVFQQQYESVRRDEVVGVLLALFLGAFGIHHFYLGRVGLGILYVCFSWTGVTWILGFIECFFMPGRVRMYNAVQAAGLAAALGIGIPGYVGYPGWVVPGGWAAPGAAYGYAAPGAAATGMIPVGIGSGGALVACRSCGRANAGGARFCASCGTNLG